MAEQNDNPNARVSLDVSGLTKDLPNGKRLLDGIRFNVGEGEFVAILGPSGAGKSLTLRAVLGLLAPTAGTVRWTTPTGAVVDTVRASAGELRALRRSLGAIFQGLNLVRQLTVLDNVMLGRIGHTGTLRSWFLGFNDDEARTALAALAQVGMEAHAARRLGSLSGGEMQRVAIARAVYQAPWFFLADEPVSSLDPRNANAIMRLMVPLAQRSPVVGVFHQPVLASRYCTRFIGIRAGRVVYDGPPDTSDAVLSAIYGAELAELRSTDPGAADVDADGEDAAEIPLAASLS